MSTDHFLTAMRLRLADLDLGSGATCQMEKGNGDDSRRAEPLDRRGEHCLKCRKGRARYGTHRAMEVALQKCLKQNGIYADMERNVPDLYKKAENGSVKEAVLDLVVRAPANPRSRFIDVTIRCPQRKDKDHGEAPGEMAELGERDKARRYGAHVMPLAFESYGRMGPESMMTLRQLTWDASTVQKCAVHRLATMMYSDWRTKLERTLLLEVADIALCCLGRWAPRVTGG